jgi:DNA-binding NtrC family response regulator
VTGYVTESYAARCQAAGFAQFVAKPVRRAMLIALIDELLRERAGTDRGRYPREGSTPSGPEAPGDFDGMVGRSDAMRAVFDDVVEAAALRVPVLITGETGTGKEQIARSIHERSSRREGPFVPVTCPSIPPDLFESELFGHERGAFTGAVERTQGLVEAARGGTMFFDEIGDLTPTAQAKLLRFLQAAEVRPVGSTRIHTADVRVLAATNVHLGEAIRERRFRRDLYWRLAGFTLHVPPVRGRGDAEVHALVQFVLARLAVDLGRQAPTLSPAALGTLLRHDWPGNVREMQVRLRKALIRCGPVLDAGDLAFEELPTGGEVSMSATTADCASASGLAPPGPRWDRAEFERHATAAVADFRRERAEAALRASGGHISKAAERLAVSCRTLYRWRYGRR